MLPVLYVWTVSHADDADILEGMRHDMMDIIHIHADTEEGREFLKTLAHTLTERLSVKNLSMAEQKINRELLDATLTILRNEEPDLPIKSVAR